MANLSDINNSVVATVGVEQTNWIDDSVVSTSNSNGGTLNFARYRVQSDSTGQYHLEYVIDFSGATSASAHTITLGLGGTTFKSGITQAAPQASVTTGGFAQANAGAATLLQITDVASTGVRVSGRALLDGKPSWYDANLEKKAGLPIATATLEGISTLPQEATASAAGLQPAISDGSNFAASGEIGEHLTSNVGYNSGSSLTGSIVTITSITVTPGVWQISGIAQAYVSAGASCTGLDGYISETTNSSAPLEEGVTSNNISFGSSPPQDKLVGITIPPFVRKYTSSTTLYILGNATGSGTLNGSGSITAIRIR